MALGSESKVSQLQIIVAVKQAILGLDISVCNPTIMQKAGAIKHLREEIPCITLFKVLVLLQKIK
jgi:hypothetical protein